MAGKNNFQRLLVIHVENGVLERPLFLRFSAEAEGSECAARLEALLVREIAPGAPVSDIVLTVSGLTREYEREAHPFAKDFSALHTIIKVLRPGNQCRLGGQLDLMMKRINRIAATSIQWKVRVLDRATGWAMRKVFLTMPR